MTEDPQREVCGAGMLPAGAKRTRTSVGENAADARRRVGAGKKGLSARAPGAAGKRALSDSAAAAQYRHRVRCHGGAAPGHESGHGLVRARRSHHIHPFRRCQAAGLAAVRTHYSPTAEPPRGYERLSWIPHLLRRAGARGRGPRADQGATWVLMPSPRRTRESASGYADSARGGPSKLAVSTTPLATRSSAAPKLKRTAIEPTIVISSL